MSEETVLVVVEDSVTGDRGWGEIRQRLTRVTELPVSVLEQNINQFLQLVGRLFSQVDQQIGVQSDMKLDEVELQVEISGKGEVKLLAGGEASGKGVIKLKFKRHN